MQRTEPLIRELLSLPTLSDTQISPDGSTIAVVMRHVDWQSKRTYQTIKILRRETGKAMTGTEKDEVGAPSRRPPDNQTLAFLASSPPRMPL